MTRFNFLSRAQFFVYSLFLSALAYAQDAKPDLDVDVDVDKTGDAMGGDWMSSPLVWVIGALVLIVIIALVARGGGNNK
ncbi:MAG: hypothetical protein K0M63_07750 [Weeksellaceae bacterium]|nr:hypothetical protein [Weeksellaceae bacterium]